MKQLHRISLTTALAALALSLIVSPTTLEAQPGQQRGRNSAAEAPPPPPPPPPPRARGPVDSDPLRQGPPPERGPRGPEASAPGMPGPGGPMANFGSEVQRFWDRPSAAERLALTEEQVQKLDASFNKARPAIDKGEARMRKATEVLNKAFNSDTEPDIAMLHSTVEEFSNAQKEMMMAGIEHRAAVQSILTPDQMKTLREMRPTRTRGGPMIEGGPRALPDLPPAAPGDAPAAPEGKPQRPSREGARRELTPETNMNRDERLKAHEERVRSIIDNRQAQAPE